MSTADEREFIDAMKKVVTVVTVVGGAIGGFFIKKNKDKKKKDKDKDK